MFTFVYFTLLHNIYCLQRCTASMQRSFLSVRAHSFLYECILIVCVSQNPENIHNRWENSEFLQQIFGEVVHNNILYVLSMSNLKQIFLPFSREAIFYFVLQPLGWYELKICSNFTIEYRFARNKSRISLKNKRAAAFYVYMDLYCQETRDIFSLELCIYLNASTFNASTFSSKSVFPSCIFCGSRSSNTLLLKSNSSKPPLACRVYNEID